MIFLLNNTKNQWKCYRFFLLFFSIGDGKEKSNRKGNKKAPQHEAEDRKLAGSPDRTIFELFV